MSVEIYNTLVKPKFNIVPDNIFWQGIKHVKSTYVKTTEDCGFFWLGCDRLSTRFSHRYWRGTLPFHGGWNLCCDIPDPSRIDIPN